MCARIPNPGEALLQSANHVN